MPDLSVDSFWIKRGIVELLRGGLQEALHGRHVCGCVNGSFFPLTHGRVDFGGGDRRRRRWRERRRFTGGGEQFCPRLAGRFDKSGHFECRAGLKRLDGRDGS